MFVIKAIRVSFPKFCSLLLQPFSILFDCRLRHQILRKKGICSYPGQRVAGAACSSRLASTGVPHHTLPSPRSDLCTTWPELQQPLIRGISATNLPARLLFWKLIYPRYLSAGSVKPQYLFKHLEDCSLIDSIIVQYYRSTVVLESSIFEVWNISML